MMNELSNSFLAEQDEYFKTAIDAYQLVTVWMGKASCGIDVSTVAR